MTTDNSEIDAINHLIEIEKNASILVNDALAESDKRLAAARAKFSAEYGEKFEKITEELESDYQKKLEAIVKKYEQDLEAYRASLKSKNQNKKEFFELLEKLLFN